MEDNDITYYVGQTQDRGQIIGGMIVSTDDAALKEYRLCHIAQSKKELTDFFMGHFYGHKLPLETEGLDERLGRELRKILHYVDRRAIPNDPAVYIGEERRKEPPRR